MSSKEIIVKNPSEIFKQIKLDYTKLIISGDSNIDFDFKFPITPSEFLKYAQSDFKLGTQKALVNSITNAKRSIDCLIDTVLNNLNINPKNIPDNAIKFCDDILQDGDNDIQPTSLKLFTALGLAPSLLISEVRQLRHKVEHEYQIPDSNNVKRAIEVAELLLNNVKAKQIYSTTIEITDLKHKETHPRRIAGIKFDTKSSNKAKFDKIFTLFVNINNLQDRVEYIFKCDEMVYFYFLRAMFVAHHDNEALIETVKKILLILDIKTPIQYVKIIDTIDI